MEILFSKDATKLYPASTTKPNGAGGLGNGDPDEVVTVGNEAYLCPYDSSKAGLDIGEEITLENLLYGLMLLLGCSIYYSSTYRLQLADQLCPSMTVKGSADLMNKFTELGAKIPFRNSDGYHDDEHFPPYDMALISAGL